MPDISILGSTGSIGKQALEVIGSLGDDYRVIALTANSSVSLLSEQARFFMPEFVALADTEKFDILTEELNGFDIELAGGKDALKKASSLPGADIVLIAVVGFSGFEPALHALKSGKKVALANKESLIIGGELIAREIPGFSNLIIPVDSEHSAIYQCLRGEDKRSVKRIILTASGGPFRGMKKRELEGATAKEALKHPNWEMGAKITIDSATMMNKGFEVLEARWLFDIPLEKIEVLVHPQSIVHSLVEFVDGSVIAQLSSPDMRLPIQYAFTYPDRQFSLCPQIDFVKQPLYFEEPDNQSFPCLSYAYEAGRVGGTMPACLNAANEVAVELFLRGEIGFNGIAALIRAVMDDHETILNPTFDEITEADSFSRERALHLVSLL